MADFAATNLEEIKNSPRDFTSSLIIASICFTVLASYYYYKNVYSYWQRRNIPGPKPWPLIGNALHLLFLDRMKLEKQWTREYGKVYGIYMGSRPHLVVADSEVMLQVCVKDFDAFQNHHLNDFANNYHRNFLVFLKSEHWKKVRALMSPTFTSGKIKKMFKFLDLCANDLVDLFNEQLESKAVSEGKVNVKSLYELFTMDAITTCCYGLKLERDGSKDLKTAATRNDFVRMAMHIFGFSFVRVLIGILFPKPILKYFQFKIVPEEKIQPFVRKVNQLISNRRKATKKFDDYLQLLIDARLDDKLELNEMDLEENHHAGLTHESLIQDQTKMVNEIKSGSVAKDTKIVLTDMEVLSGGVFLLAVGLETTSTLLAHVTYTLAFHQDIQKRLHEELIKIVEFNEDKTKVSFDYDSLTSCKYLDAVLSETLRNVSAVVQIDREANSDYHLEKYNVDIPKGALLNLALYSVMNDPDYWEEPEKFNPERFMPGNKEKIVPGSYVPFGVGPRHCIGMRFSLTEAKLALAKILINFQFDPAPNTKFPPELSRFMGITKLKHYEVILTPRKS